MRGKERSLKKFLEGSRTSVCDQKRVENSDDAGDYVTKYEVDSLDVSRNQKIREKGDLRYKISRVRRKKCQKQGESKYQK